MIEDKLIYAEMLAHVPTNTHRLPKKVLVIGDFDGVVTQQLSIHTDIEEIVVLQSQVCEVDIFGSSKCSVVTSQSVAFLSECEQNSFDVVIINADINDEMYDRVFYGLIHRCLKSDGVFATPSAAILSEAGSFEDSALKIGEYFKIVMPSFYMQKNQTDNILIASNKYHPTADLILQRGDLLEGLEYYNCDLHLASFAMPNFVKKRLKNIVKI